MNTIAKAAVIALAVATLAACDNKAPEAATESPDVTEAALPAPETPTPEAPTQPADELVTKPDNGVDVKLPDVQVTSKTATPAPTSGKPASGQ